MYFFHFLSLTSLFAFLEDLDLFLYFFYSIERSLSYLSEYVFFPKFSLQIIIQFDQILKPL